MRHRTPVLLLTTAALGGTLALAPVAVAVPTAAPTAPSAPSAPTSDLRGPGGMVGVAAPVTRDVSAAAARGVSREAAVRAYWTPERMRSAEPVATPRVTHRQAERMAGLIEPAPMRRVVGPTAGAPSAHGRKPFSRVAGKVFFRDGRSSYVCSAAAINSSSKSLVSTAGHCVHGGPGGTWHQNWIFVPGFQNGKRPKGTFVAQHFFAFDDWINYGQTARGFNADLAFVKLGRSKGKKVVQAVGGNGLTTGGGYELPIRIFGYPANIRDGRVQQTCSGRTNRLSWSGFSFRRKGGCGFGGGSSGGPWVTGYKARQGRGQLRGITSFGPNDNAFIATPYLGDDARALWRYADTGGR